MAKPFYDAMRQNYRAQYKTRYNADSTVTDEQLDWILDNIFHDEDSAKQDEARTEAMHIPETYGVPKL